MKQYLFPSRIPSLPIASSALEFPIHRVYCIGRNYRDHVLEMGNDPNREPPFYFMKPADAISTNTQIPYPPKTSNLHYEGELVVAIGKSGFQISHDSASHYIYGYALGCDLTRRDIQSESKQRGRPWCSSKGFDFSAPCGAILPKEKSLFDLSLLSLSSSSSSSWSSSSSSSSDSDLLKENANLTLKVNQKLRQQSTLNHMIWSIPEIISHISQFVCLQPGDLIMTGTPAGVGSLQVGDMVSISCGDLPLCEFQLTEHDSPIT